MKMNVKRLWTLWSLWSSVHLQWRIVIWEETNGQSQSPNNKKQHQHQQQIKTNEPRTVKPSLHVSLGATGGVRTRTAACKWFNPTATTLRQRTKQTASLADGCRDSDNASRRVEALGVPALQDRGRRGRFTDGNNRKDGGKIRIQSWRRGFINTGWGQPVFSLASGPQQPTLLLPPIFLASLHYFQGEKVCIIEQSREKHLDLRKWK
jgi:hypothetical protein